MTATLHKHTWRRLGGYSGCEWRCTSALHIAQLLENDFDDKGCLGTLVYWSRRKIYIFSAPGVSVQELSDRPLTMMIDRDYLAKAATYAESLRRLAA